MFNKYLEIAKINTINSASFIVALLSKSGIVFLRIWVYTQLYTATFLYGDPRITAGTTVSATIWLLMLVQSFQSATRPEVCFVIEEEVQTGTLTYSINRPYYYPLFHYFGYLGRLLPNLIVNIVIGCLTCLVLVHRIPLRWEGLAFGSILLFLGLTVDFLIFFLIGISAFWVEDIKPFRWIYSKAKIVLGGMIFPLSLFPEALRKFAEMTPFALTFYAPAQMTTQFEMATFQHFLTFQLCWIAILSVAVYYIFNKAIRVVTVNGG